MRDSNDRAQARSLIDTLYDKLPAPRPVILVVSIAGWWLIYDAVTFFISH